MTRPAGAAEAAERVLFGLLLLLLLWLPLPWASNRVWASSLFACLAAMLFGVWLLLVSAGHIRVPQIRGMWIPGLLWLAWLSWIALQCWPLAPEEVATWSARAHASQAALALVQASALWTLSIAPSRTVDALILSGGYCALYYLTLMLTAGHPSRARRVLQVIVLSGLAQALYGSLMTLSGLEYGFFARKTAYLGVATGTFVNRNHLAGYLTLCSAAGVALLLADLDRRVGTVRLRVHVRKALDWFLSPKSVIRVSLAVMVIALVLTRSRMGNAAFFASLVTCGLGYVLLRERWLALRTALLLASLVAVDLFIVSRWFGLEQVAERIEQTDLDSEVRTRALEAMQPTLEAYIWTGSGLGTFALAFQADRPADLEKYFDHAHNEYVQFLVETGLPGTAIVLCLAGLHWLHAVRLVVERRRRMPAATGFCVLMALTGAGLHALADFNLQIPAYAASLVCLMALAGGFDSRGRPTARKKSRRFTQGSGQRMLPASAGDRPCGGENR